MHVLMLHITIEDTTEYAVHRLLAEHVDASQTRCSFIWQQNCAPLASLKPSNGLPSHSIDYYDFGRNMSLEPRPSKARRSLMMLRRLPGAIAFLSDRARVLRPDLIYTCQQWWDLYTGRLLSAQLGIPHVVHIHYPVGPWLGVGVVPMLARADHLIAVSDFIRVGAIEAGIPAPRIRTLHNPIDTTRFNRTGDRAAVRAEFGWPATTPLVVAAGRLDPYKGHLHLLQSFAHLTATVPEARLLICGAPTADPGYAEMLKQRAVELGLGERAVFAGNRSDLPEILSAADVFCLPTENEAFGLVFIEAMICGIPVAACHSGAVPEIVVDGETGLISPLGDSSALANNLEHLLRNPVRAQQMGAAGRDRALREFAPDAIAQRWSDMLHALSGTTSSALTRA